jgi:hypothetical protein
MSTTGRLTSTWSEIIITGHRSLIDNLPLYTPCSSTQVDKPPVSILAPGKRHIAIYNKGGRTIKGTGWDQKAANAAFGPKSGRMCHAARMLQLSNGDLELRLYLSVSACVAARACTLMVYTGVLMCVLLMCRRSLSHHQTR